MKMPSDLYAELAAALRPHCGDQWREKYAAAGLSPMRYRWDLLHFVESLGTLPRFFMRCYAAGLKDAHIDTALRRITATDTAWGTSTCYTCGKRILRGHVIMTAPCSAAEAAGDFVKSRHPACFRADEYNAALAIGCTDEVAGREADEALARAMS